MPDLQAVGPTAASGFGLAGEGSVRRRLFSVPAS